MPQGCPLQGVDHIILICWYGGSHIVAVTLVMLFTVYFQGIPFNLAVIHFQQGILLRDITIILTLNRINIVRLFQRVSFRGIPLILTVMFLKGNIVELILFNIIELMHFYSAFLFHLVQQCYTFRRDCCRQLSWQTAIVQGIPLILTVMFLKGNISELILFNIIE